MQKTLSSKLPFQPISLLDFGFSFNLETKHLISLCLHLLWLEGLQIPVFPGCTSGLV